MIKLICYFILFGIILLLNACAQIGNAPSNWKLEVEEGKVIIWGFITTETVTEFKSILKANNIQLVKFHNCRGGKLTPTLELSKLIRSRKLSTEAEGDVSSGCQIAFLSGVSRQFVNARDVIMLTHSPYNDDGSAANKDDTDRMIDYLKKYTDDRFPGLYENDVRANHGGGAGLYMLSIVRSGKVVQFTFVCPVKLSDELIPDRCTAAKPAKFESLGIITIPHNSIAIK